MTVNHAQNHMTCDASHLKRSARTFYEHELLATLFHRILHPGGLELTERLATLAGITPHSLVLDIAGGWGTSAIFLTKRFKCTVVNLDLSSQTIHSAKDTTKIVKTANKVIFHVGDAEHLPFKDAIFDIILSECSLCLFPSKKKALAEMYRVIKPEGIVAISDVTLTDTPRELDTQLLYLSCIAGAESLKRLKTLFTETGFEQVQSIDVSEIINDIYMRIQEKTSYLKPILRILCTGNIDYNYEELSAVGVTLEQLVLQKKLGYGLILGQR
jgi:ubiquinone/menaquinone biosynthesis C-methylase UbiE